MISESAEAIRREGRGNCVFVVDDDSSMRVALRNLLRSCGFETHLFASAQEFLTASRPDMVSCLILDVQMPGLNGPQLQRELLTAGDSIPIIFITAAADDLTVTRGMEAGAIGFFTKPFRDQDLLDAIYLALAIDRARRTNNKTTD